MGSNPGTQERREETARRRSATASLSSLRPAEGDAGSCSGFVGGVIQGVNLIGNLLRAQNAIERQFICLPEGLQAAQLLEAVLVDLRKRPDDIAAPAELHIYRTIGTKYPCAKSESKP